jgi:hypothetical protein
MRKLMAGMLLILASSACLMAGNPCPTTVSCIAKAPEFDPTAGIAALALLGGVVLIVRGRRKKA